MKDILEAGFRAVFENSGSMLLLIEPNSGRIVDANSAALHFYGYSRESLVSMTLGEINVLDWNDIARERRNAPLPKKNAFIFRHRLASGEERDVEIFFSSIDGDETPLLFSIVHDVTAFKQTQQELRNSEELYRTTFQATSDAISITRSHDGLFVDTNLAHLNMLGYKHDEIIGHTAVELKIWSNDEERDKFLSYLRNGQTIQDPIFEMRKRDGTTFVGRVSVSKLEIDGIEYLLTATTDLSAVRRAEERIKALAFFDSLTQLPNRNLLLDRIAQAQFANVREGTDLALLLIDVDKFKATNDMLGRSGGDLLLKQIGSRLIRCVSEADTVARVGADEFCILIPGLPVSTEDKATSIQQIADKICASIKEPLLVEQHECLITACIGIKTLDPSNAEDAVGLLHRAEIALHQAKAKGRNSIHFFSPVMHAAANARITLEEDLRAAIKEEQFTLLYQPQVDPGGLVGTEALIRWNHPTRGVISPLEFIPLAEETGLILPLGKWVLETACQQIVTWESQEEMLKIPIAVNISAQQFRQTDFVEEVLGVLGRTGADPDKLKLELTETMLVENLEEVIVKIKLLKSQGLQFSMDDFGTGYSSLAYLKRLPLDQLKIDRAFVRDIVADVASGAIAQMIISLGSALGLSVIAEGIETEEQRAFLTKLGCRSFQGYLFSRPLPLKEFEAWQQKFAKSARLPLT